MSMLDRDAEERLRQFFGGTFHQDWSLDGESWRDVLSAFVQSSSHAAIRQLGEDLTSLLSAAGHDDEALRSYVATTLWCDYLPGDDPQSMRGWLRELCAALSEEVGRP